MLTFIAFVAVAGPQKLSEAQCNGVQNSLILRKRMIWYRVIKFTIYSFKNHTSITLNITLSNSEASNYSRIRNIMLSNNKLCIAVEYFKFINIHQYQHPQTTSRIWGTHSSGFKIFIFWDIMLQSAESRLPFWRNM